MGTEKRDIVRYMITATESTCSADAALWKQEYLQGHGRRVSGYNVRPPRDPDFYQFLDEKQHLVSRLYFYLVVFARILEQGGIQNIAVDSVFFYYPIAFKGRRVQTSASREQASQLQ
jgi:hypothetical protein